MPVPFFADFQKATQDFFKKDKYDFGRQVHVEAKQDDVKMTAKINTRGDRTTTKFIANIKPSWGTLEATEQVGKGLTVDVRVPKCWKNINFSHKIQPDMKMETRLKLKQKDSYWNVDLKNKFVPNDSGKRTCTSTLGVAVGDDSLNLSVGGSVEVVDSGDVGVYLRKPNMDLVGYKLGFLYTPDDKSSYSLIYTPESKDLKGGLKYDFSLLRKCSDNCSISARAQGKVETKVTKAPELSFGGSWKLDNGSCVQGFYKAGTNNEWGLAYKMNVTASLCTHFGVCSFFDEKTNEMRNSVGYKICFS